MKYLIMLFTFSLSAVLTVAVWSTTDFYKMIYMALIGMILFSTFLMQWVVLFGSPKTIPTLKTPAQEIPSPSVSRFNKSLDKGVMSDLNNFLENPQSLVIKPGDPVNLAQPLGRFEGPVSKN